MNGPQDTKSRILDVAEVLLGEQGIERVSVRDITEKAAVNVAAINYHFGSKEDLIAAVFERRLAPLNAARLQLLDAAERDSGKKGPTIERILEAFIRPSLACCAERSSASGSSFALLLGRCLAETRPELEAFLMKHFAPVARRFEEAILKALPHLSRSDVYWRLKFTFGALHHWLLTREKFLPDCAERTSTEEQVRKLIAFTAAGFRG